MRTLIRGASVFAAVVLAALVGPARAETLPGVTATEIRIGNTMPYSGFASAFGVIGRFESAYFRMLDEAGGIAGRRVVFLTEDDGASPPRTVEQIRKLVEAEDVAFVFNMLGTSPTAATEKYMNAKKVPQLFVASGADKWADPAHFPWTMGWQPSYRVEAQIYAKYILRTTPDAKIGILYQNDDFGKDYLQGFRDGLGDKFDRMVVKIASYEVSDPTVDSQAVALQSSGADTLLEAATPKFAAQIIRKLGELNWHPRQFLSNVSISPASVIGPAGSENAVGVISAAYSKDPGDPTWKDDPGMQQYHALMARLLPDANQADSNYVYAMGVTLTLMQVLKQCDGDFSRANVMKQAASLHDLVLPTLLPGITVSTGPTQYHPIRKMRMQRWDGKRWVLFGDIIEGSGS